MRTFKRSRDPRFAAKLADIVGLGACPRAGHGPDPGVDPPAHAVVLSIDEKSQIQTLDRSQPGLPIKPGRCQTMTHDYKRHGTTTLFAALSVLDGTVIGRCMQRHRHLEFIRFLNAVERQVPAANELLYLVRQAVKPGAQIDRLAGEKDLYSLMSNPPRPRRRCGLTISNDNRPIITSQVEQTLR